MLAPSEHASNAIYPPSHPAMSRGHERCAHLVQGPRGALATALTREKSSADAYRIASTGLTRYARYGALFTLSVVGGLPGLVPLSSVTCPHVRILRPCLDLSPPSHPTRSQGHARTAIQYWDRKSAMLAHDDARAPSWATRADGSAGDCPCDYSLRAPSREAASQDARAPRAR